LRPYSQVLKVCANDTMQHISHTELPSIKQSRGGRISSPKLRKSLEQSQDFCGLEEDVNKYDLLLLVKRIGKGAGFSTKMINLLDYYMAFTRDMDWEEGSSPIVYQSLSRTALDLGVSERQIQKLEKALFEVGAITWNDSGNHRRYGQRCPDTGAILYAYGVDLTPLAYLKTALQDKLHEKQLHDQAWMETKRQISWYRAQIRAVLAELELIEDIDPPYHELEAAYNDIAVQIRTTMSLENINSRLGEHKELHATVLEVLNAYGEAQEESIIESKETKKGSSKSEQTDTHYKYTKKQLSNKLDTSRDELNCYQESSSRDSEIKKERTGQGDRSQEQGSEPENLLTACGLQHITLKQALNASSDRFKDHIPLEQRAMNWHDVVTAAYSLKGELHISQNAWSHACVTLGRTGAAICLLLTDQATQRADDPVRKPAGYFNAMINRAKSGELHLNKSIFGILKREDGSEI
jgi:replication initiation protein RepC